MAEFQKTNPATSAETTRKFVQFIMVQAQNILYVLGRIPTPEGERLPPNLQAAKMMIDHLDLIALKTQGNLNSQEEKILKEALQQVQMAFVEASGGTPPSMMPDRGPQMEMPDLEDEDLEAEPSVVRETPPATSASPLPPKPNPARIKKSSSRATDEISLGPHPDSGIDGGGSPNQHQRPGGPEPAVPVELQICGRELLLGLLGGD